MVENLNDLALVLLGAALSIVTSIFASSHQVILQDRRDRRNARLSARNNIITYLEKTKSNLHWNEKNNEDIQEKQESLISELGNDVWQHYGETIRYIDDLMPHVKINRKNLKSNFNHSSYNNYIDNCIDNKLYFIKYGYLLSFFIIYIKKHLNALQSNRFRNRQGDSAKP